MRAYYVLSFASSDVKHLLGEYVKLQLFLSQFYGGKITKYEFFVGLLSQLITMCRNNIYDQLFGNQQPFKLIDFWRYSFHGTFYCEQHYIHCLLQINISKIQKVKFLCFIISLSFSLLIYKGCSVDQFLCGGGGVIKNPQS